MTLHTVKPAREAKTRATAQPPVPGTNFAGTSVPRHLARGAVGFGLITASIGLIPVIGPAALLAAPLSLIAFRGCPTCWLAGLAQTISHGRLQRHCTTDTCTLTRPHPAANPTKAPPPGINAPTAPR
ncbi:hypothetical protein [Streptomyces phytophilus]|uniref:hypothetical protein n=1 Tax=Streptomyces phytophilus TaxID=722715 RepID=UPI0015F08598|nr:hypothetical protein [Streptomyces phytophilus]